MCGSEGSRGAELCFPGAAGVNTPQHLPVMRTPLLQLHHGADIARMPAGSFLHRAALANNAGPKAASGGYGVLGVVRHGSGAVGGHVAVMGDSNCLDSSHQQSNCFGLLHKLLDRLNKVRGISGSVLR